MVSDLAGGTLTAQGAPLVVVHNGRRDEYQVALALQEAGRLAALVTDYYSKFGLVSRRCNRALRTHAVHNTWKPAAVQLSWRIRGLLRARSGPIDWSGVEAALASRAHELAVANDAGVLAYSGLARSAFPGIAGQRALFVFHPMPGLIREVLGRDAEQWGLADRILERERDFFDRDAEEMSRLEVRMASRILVASSFSRRSVHEATDRVTASIAVVPYGCPPVAPTVRRGDGAPRFLFVGQGVQRKGLHHLAAVWPMVSARHPAAELTLVMGVVDPDLDLGGLRGRSVITSRVSQTELDELMDSHDVLVLPSLVEGFGLVITEALAHGMHVVATDHTGLVDLPRHPGAGTVVTPGSREELSAALLELIEGDGPDPEASYATAADYQWSDYRAAVRSAL